MWTELARAWQPLSRRYDQRAIQSMAYRLGERLSDSIVKTRLPTGSPITLDMRDHAHRAVFFRGELEPVTTAAFRRLVTPTSVVFDVGANVGYYSLLARDLGAADVHAFEPNPHVHTLFAQSLQRQSGGITLNAAACGAVPAELPLFLPDQPHNVGTATLRTDRARQRTKTTVPVITLDDYCAELNLRPTIVKIDVEGFEASVLQGATQTLSEHRPDLLCEIADPAARRLLLELGYHEQVLSGRDGRYSDSWFTAA